MTYETILKNMTNQLSEALLTLDVKNTANYIIQIGLIEELQKRGFERSFSEKIASYLKIDMVGIEITDEIKEILQDFVLVLATVFEKIYNDYKEVISDENILLFMENIAKNMSLTVNTQGD